MISASFFEQIQQQLKEQLPVVVYRKPNRHVVKAILQHTQKLYTIKDYSEKGFVFAPFDATTDAVLMPIENSKVIECDYVVSNDSEKPIKNSHVLESDKNQHINLVQKGIDAINNSVLKKVVLSRYDAVEFSEKQPLEIFKSLLQQYPTAFVYMWYHPKVGWWLGATPETLIEISGSSFKTMALAGTQKYKGILDVCWQDKEKEEQQFVTDFIVNSLQPSTRSLQVSETETVQAGHVLHLRTLISGTLNFTHTDIKQVLDALHPTPAVCGLPKEEAKQFILQNESYNRTFYTGFLGELHIQEKKSRNTNRRNIENNAYASVKKRTHLFVNLRCMQIIENQAHIYIGGGITKDSNPEAEWLETVTKSQVIKKVLQ